MKLLAMYLPQYHFVPENDSWWGKGYTDWDNARKAVPFFNGHYQPKEPLNDNYYDLSKKDVLSWQASLARKYGIDGFSLYHYWFKDSHKVLWKPAENLLHDKGIAIEFCLTWANHPWFRREPGRRGKGTMFLEIDYGDEVEWKNHYSYLSGFFHDSRYIKIEGKPLFLFTNYHEVYTLGGRGMTDYWHDLAIKDGFNGIYFVGMDSVRTEKYRGYIFEDPLICASVDFVPGKIRDDMRSRDDWIRVIKRLVSRCLPNKNFLNRYLALTFDYDRFYEILLKYPHGKNNWRACLVNYDDTPRMGKEGIISKGVTPELFQKYLEASIKKTKAEGQDFLFLTAWNEWGEGNYLEPDKKYGYGWLKAVRSAREKYGI